MNLIDMQKNSIDFEIVKEQTLQFDYCPNKIYIMLIKESNSYQVLVTSRRSKLLGCICSTELEALKLYSVINGKLSKFHYYEHAIKCSRIVSRYKSNKEILLAIRFINSYESLDRIEKLRRRYGYEIKTFISIAISNEDEEVRLELYFLGNKKAFAFFRGKPNNMKFYLYDDYESQNDF